MLYLPPPEKSYRAFRVLAVLAPKGPPKDWNQYEDLLRTRLLHLLQDQPARSGLVNYLLSESLLEENPEDDDLVEWLLESDQYQYNPQVSLAADWWNARKRPKVRNVLAKQVHNDPKFLKSSAQEKLQEYNSLNVWEWWDSL